MPPYFRFVAAALMFALALVLIWPLAVELFAVDACLDRGGSYDYLDSVCDFSENHPYYPVLDRHGFRVAGFLAFCALGFAAVVFGLRDR